jgi:hypothetical protein
MKTAIQSILTPVAIYAVLSLGCGTSYSPREPGRLNFVMSGTGEEALEKDGKRYRVQGFSDELVEAVRGNSAAEEHARRFVHHQRLASGFAIATAVALGFAVIFLAASMAEPAGTVSPEPTPTQDNGWKLGLASGIAALIAGGTLTGAVVNSHSAEGHLYDAINIYNDDVARKRTR